MYLQCQGALVDHRARVDRLRKLRSTRSNRPSWSRGLLPDPAIFKTCWMNAVPAFVDEASWSGASD